ncbi:MAG: pilus assembly protein TadG-related protein [Sphingomicrobium sp.]
MLKAFRKLWNNDRGNMIVIAAASLPLLIGSAGLATDTIQWALWKRQLQRAADSAAIAGVYDRFAHSGASTNTATAVDHDLSLNQHTGMTLESGYPAVTFPANAGSNKNQVRVVLAVQKSLSFSSMFLTTAPVITATAQAAGVEVSGDFCVLSLQENSKTGIQATGNASISMDCGMMTNSTATNAAAGQGSASVTATTIAAAGGIQQSNNWTVQTYQPYSPQLDDPYASLDPSTTDGDFDNCSANPPPLTVDNNTDGLVVSGGACYGSLDIQSNRTLTLKDGTYVIDGGNVNIQGTLHLTNASLLLTNKSSAANATIGTIDMNSSGQIDATAPTTGKWAGMAIYQDRRAVDNSPTGTISANSPNKINGNSTNKIKGVIYFPSQQITYNGTGTGTATCTQFVAKRIYWSGNSGLNNFTKNCPGSGIQAINAPLKVRLVV